MIWNQYVHRKFSKTHPYRTLYFYFYVGATPKGRFSLVVAQQMTLTSKQPIKITIPRPNDSPNDKGTFSRCDWICMENLMLTYNQLKSIMNWDYTITVSWKPPNSSKCMHVIDCFDHLTSMTSLRFDKILFTQAF